MIYSIQQIVEITEGKPLNLPLIETQIERLLFDSRHLVFPNRTLFFAFKSKRQDGHHFIKELYRQGVRNFIVTQNFNSAAFPSANFILVEDSVRALQQLAVFHRRQFSLKTIGITGSNGKTIIKEWLYQLLHTDFQIIRNPGSYNSQIGVPLSVWQIEEEHNLGIFEAGISKVGEMEKIAPVIDCEMGIFTNIGEAHSEGFDSKEEKINEKLKLFDQTETIVYCRDNEIVDIVFQKIKNKKLVSWSQKKEADLRIIAISKKEKASEITIAFQLNRFAFSIPFTDSASIENAIHCCAIMLLLKVPIAKIQKGMPKLEPVSMRLEVKEGINGCTIINDSYNSDLTSLELALNFATKSRSNNKFLLILSDIFQSGQSPDVLYKKVAHLIIAKKVDSLVAIGKEISAIKKYLPKDFSVAFFKNTANFLKAFKSKDFYSNTILLKGARVFEFEKIVNRFEEKVHKTVLEVDLSAIIHNLKVYGQYLNSNTKLMAMVKASAYGSGSVEVAKILEFYKADYLAVAYADEGVELRKAGIQLPILVLNPEEASFSVMVRYQLEPEMYSIELFRRLLDFLPPSQSISIHIKLDTGMHRLGFEEKNIATLLDLLKTRPSVKVKSIFSHLAASDMAAHDAFSREQVDRFLKMYELVCSNLRYRPIRHILNSSGILRFPQYQLDMVRLGIGLYGIDSSGIVQQQLKVVNTLKATISQIKTIAGEATIGYNRSGKINQSKRIATITIGYADGLARKTGNGKYKVSVQGQKAPIIGNVCMDMCMIDISDIPNAKVGDEVVIFGSSPGVEELANCLGTIPYEVFTGVSNRVKRIYFRT